MKEITKTGVLRVSDRHMRRRMKVGTQGSVIRSLVELITNSDDSYRRLERDNQLSGKGVIVIVYNQQDGRGFFEVRDYGEGMSADKVEEGFTEYGAATSGKDVRGYFGQGAKDVLAMMIDARICTFKDGYFTEFFYFSEENSEKIKWEIKGPSQATPELREKHKIDENGTVAYFEANRDLIGSLPRFSNLQEKIANNYMLRKIMMNRRRKVLLVNNKGEKRQLRKFQPPGEEVLADEFIIKSDKHGDFPIRISVFRAQVELDQTGDDRDGGLLVLDEKEVVLDITLFKYDNEPLASRFFGEVIVDGFREKLLDKEEPVLLEEREGLNKRHPFCKKLVEAIEERLAKLIKVEKLREKREAETKIDFEAQKRYKKAIKILNEIAEEETQTAVNLGDVSTEALEPPPDGIILIPQFAEITVGRRYNLKLRIDTRVFRPGALIKISCDSSAIRVITPEVKITREDRGGIITRFISIQGVEANKGGTLKVVASDIELEAKIFVIPEKEILYEEGMAFRPETLTLRPNKVRRISLLVYVKMIEGGSEIKIKSEDESIKVSKETITVNEFDAVKNVATYHLEVWGEGVGTQALITAEYENYMACCEVKIRSKEKEDEKQRKGLFDKPHFSYEENPIQRSSYSEETKEIIIYMNFPTVKHYLGDKGQYKKSLVGQVFIADLVAERSFNVIARRKVENVPLLDARHKEDEIRKWAYKYSKDFGKKVHEALVDQKLLEEAKSVIEREGDESR